MRSETATESARVLRDAAGRLQRLAAAPRDDSPLDELAAAEAELREAGARSRAALEERESLESSARLADERLAALDRSLSEREGLPPSARVLADAGRSLALSLLDVDPGYEKAVAAALFGRASAVLADGPLDAFELAERSRREGLGTLRRPGREPRSELRASARPRCRPRSRCSHTSARPRAESPSPRCSRASGSSSPTSSCGPSAEWP